MSEFSSKTLRFTINWKVTTFSILLMPILVSLGIWQLERAEQKQTILEQWETQQALPPLKLTELNHSLIERKKNEHNNDSSDVRHPDQSFRRIRFLARFDGSKYWLIEGKTHRGQVGYHVVMAASFQSPKIIGATSSQSYSDKLVLINRGWIKSSAYREDLPVFTTPLGVVEVTGNLNAPSSALFVEPMEDMTDVWPKKVLDIQITRMSKEYGKTFLNKVVQIDPENVHALVAFWPKINVTPQKHQAYAFQWFAMAFALLVLWFCANSNFSTWLKNKFN